MVEEMLDLCHMKGTTTIKNIFEHVNSSLGKFNIDRKNIYLITTDVALLQQKVGFKRKCLVVDIH